MNNVPALKSFTTMNGLVLKEFAYTDQLSSLMPYRFSDSLQKSMVEMAVKVPFDRIVDKSMGISTCTTCGSRYAGQETEKCSHFDYFWDAGNWSSTNYTTQQEAIKHVGYSGKVTGRWTKCGGHVNWDLFKNFSDQEDFFRVIERASQYVKDQGMSFMVQSGIMKYEDCLPPGLAAHIDSNYLVSQVSDLKLRLDQHETVLKEIANRMQAAGSNLLNGGHF